MLPIEMSSSFSLLQIFLSASKTSSWFVVYLICIQTTLARNEKLILARPYFMIIWSNPADIAQYQSLVVDIRWSQLIGSQDT